MSKSKATANRLRVRCTNLAVFASLLWFFSVLCLSGAGTESGQPVRFGFSRSMFLDFNENDTRAAIKLHASIIGSAQGIAVSESPSIFGSLAEINNAIAADETDVISVTAPEYLAIPRKLLSPRLIVANIDKTHDEEYLLLVRDDSQITKLAELRGKRLIIYNSLRGLLSPLWLDVLLAGQGFEAPKHFFARVSFANKPVRTALPVFFCQEDACIVTRQSYDVLCELNPQLKTQLRVLATSPHYVPQVTCFRAALPPETLNRIIKAAIATPDSITGQQMLTIFQSSRITEISSEELDPVRQLLADQVRLRGTAEADKAKPASISK